MGILGNPERKMLMPMVVLHHQARLCEYRYSGRLLYVWQKVRWK